VWLAVRDLSVAELRAGFSGVDWILAAAAGVTNAATLFLGAARWQLLFYPDHRPRRFWTLFRGVVIGQMLNIVIPVRVGEVARIYAVAGREQVSKARVLATIAVEKVLDVFVFALAAGVVLAVVALPPALRVRQEPLWFAAAAGAGALWWLARRPQLGVVALARFFRILPAAWRRRLAEAAEGFLLGLSPLESSRAWVPAVLLSLALVVLAALTNYLMFLAFGLELPVLAALLLLVVLQAGSVPPSLPGRIGVFHYLTVVALGLFAVERAVALSYSIALYAAAFLPKILLGAAYLAVGAGRPRAGAADVRR